MEQEKHYFKRSVSLLLSLVMIMSVFTGLNISVSAASTADGFEYIILDDGTAEITDYTGSVTELTIPSEFDGDPVTSIGREAFKGCESLTSITIPDSVTSIGDNAFSWCSALTSITIPDSVTSIGYRAFFACPALTSITIPDSVTSIGGGAFDLTAYYKDSSNWSDGALYINNHLLYINNNLFNAEDILIGEYVIKSGTKTIADEVFLYCEPLTSITIPNSVTSIGEFAFGGCTSLTSITIPDSVTSIGSSAFRNCTRLTSITIPDSVTSIGDYAFSDCSSLSSVTIGNSVESIGEGAFYECSSLTSVTIGNSVESIGEGAFYKCSSLTSVTIPGSVTSIGEAAFYCCYSLKDVYYAGSKIQWKKINIDIHNECLLNATIHFAINCDNGHTYKNGECTVCGKWQYKNTAVKLGTIKNTTSGVYLSWSKLPGADKYAVYRKTTGGWTKLTTNAKGTSFTDKTAKNNVKYTYTVRAINGTEYNTKYNKTGLSVTFMSAPKITKIANATNGVTVTWGKVSGATVYTVYRKTTGGWTKLGTSKTNTFTDKTAKNNTKYTYTVRASKSGAASAYYAGKAITFMAAPKITKIANVANGVTVTWGKVSGATVYTIYRRTTGGWTKLGTSKTNSFTDKTAKNNVKYTYTVIAAKSGAKSSFYSGKAIVRLTVPKLTKLTATSKKNTLTFGKVTGATSYIIYRKTNNGGWVKIATTKSTKYVDTKVKKGTYYTYTVRAVRGTSTSYYNTKGLKVRAK